MDSARDKSIANSGTADAVPGGRAETGLPPALLELRGVSQTRGRERVLHNVNLRVRRGEMIAVLGPLGCGKSSLLRIIAGLEQCDAGEVLLENRSLQTLPAAQRPLNMIFQDGALFPHMTVAQNVGFGPHQAGRERAEVEARVAEMLALVRMTGLADAQPAALSPSQHYRVALARGLALEPKLLLAESPMASIDRRLRHEMHHELAEIVRRVRVTCIMATDDHNEAMVAADRLALMNQGEIVQVGRPAEVYELPNSHFSAGFVGEVNFFAGTASAVSEGLVVVDCAAMNGPIKAFAAEEVQPGDSVVVAVRPEKIRLSREPRKEHNNAAAAVLEDIAYTGPQSVCQLRLASGQLVKVLDTHRGSTWAIEHGAEMQISWEIRDGILLTS